METRNEINTKLAQWITHRAENQFADDIALVLTYGSVINGTAHEKSDLDCCFIPKTEKGRSFAADFILAGVGYDIFPISWQRLEQIADLNDFLLPILGDSEILYTASESDRSHFLELRHRLAVHLKDNAFSACAAKKRINNAQQLALQLEDADNMKTCRLLGGQILLSLADAVALANGNYYHYGLKKQYEDLRAHFPDLPPAILTAYLGIMQAQKCATVKTNALQMLDFVKQYLQNSDEPSVTKIKTQPVASVCRDISALSCLYEEICSTFLKIYVSCAGHNAPLAFLSAISLQWDLDEAALLGGPDYDVLSAYSFWNLTGFSEKVHQIETSFITFIAQNGGYIKVYSCFDDFCKADL